MGSETVDKVRQGLFILSNNMSEHVEFWDPRWDIWIYVYGRYFGENSLIEHLHTTFSNTCV